MKKFMVHIRYIFLIIGALLLLALIKKIGISTIVMNVREIGWLFLPILCISTLWYILYAVAWRQFLYRLGSGIRFWDLFKIKITGEAANTLTPANFVGGDPLRIYLLRKHFSVTEGAASVVVDRTLHSIATLMVIIIGVIVSFLNFDSFPSNIKFGVPIAILVSVGFMAFIFIHQRRGIFGLFMNAYRKIGIKKNFSEKTVKKFMNLDTHIVDFYRESNKGFIIALLCHVAGRLSGVLEIYAVGHVIDSNFSLFAALILTALAPIVNAVFAFIPGALGIMEGTYSGVLYIMGMNPALGITIQIAKRIRSSFWIALGLFFLGSHDRKRFLKKDKLLEEV